MDMAMKAVKIEFDAVAMVCSLQSDATESLACLSDSLQLT